MDILENFAETFGKKDDEILRHVRAYIEWRVGQVGNFIPSVSDDVDLRTYLLQLKTSGLNQKKPTSANLFPATFLSLGQV